MERKVGQAVNVVICGCRDYSNYAKFEPILTALLDGVNLGCIITGDAKGVDEMARFYAKVNNIKLIVKRAEWTKYGLKAGPIRNSKMAALGHATIAFWDYKSRGTGNMITQAREAKHEYVHIVNLS